jgi:adenylate cyclase
VSEDPLGRAARAARAARATNRRPDLVRALRTARVLLPGDENFGDELSTADDRPSAVIGRYLAEGSLRRPADGEASTEDEAQAGEPTATREASLAALQVWQALSHRVGRGAGVVEATVMFTDLVGFSTWVLDAGDELGLELLRAVAAAVEPLIGAHRGRLIKRLGDGHMAVFSSPLPAVQAALEMHDSLLAVEVGGHRPELRVGLHIGQPRKLGGDYLGTDVNIAARVSDAAGAGEVLVSGPVLTAIGEDGLAGLRVKRRRGFRAKGVPPGIDVYRVSRA